MACVWSVVFSLQQSCLGKSAFFLSSPIQISWPKFPTEFRQNQIVGLMLFSLELDL